MRSIGIYGCLDIKFQTLLTKKNTKALDILMIPKEGFHKGQARIEKLFSPLINEMII